jgi:hypothetical protein
MCRYHPDKRCFHPSCDFLDGLGMVGICPLKPNPDGHFVVRKVKPTNCSIFDVWSRRRK